MLYADRLNESRAALSAEVVSEAEARGRVRGLQETAVEIMAELEAVISTGAA